MDIAALVVARQNRVLAIRDHITEKETEQAQQQEILDELERLSTQSSFTLSEIDFLIAHSND